MSVLEHSLFEKLPPWNQAEILAQKGRELAQRQHLDWTVTLFSLNNHLVEVWARRGLEIISSFKVSAHPVAIYEPYLPAIEVPEA
ncbi:hypothetical protein TH63_05440 [Rufibacter radiotolerans]|uniref:Uncharacterized protein n=1 Tax=Rufibacter radiotolerans TaxID=1379910 RepID=A0A0H4VN82_9BACT|nr:hypothetical protein [Rufibacter radiotolerans]AKQ45199.1 hypothetical protein TH63_05440 [Rufibacter radiotolerans]